MGSEKPSERLKIIREALGITQGNFAEALSVRPSLLKSIEYQRQRIPEEVFAAVGKTMPEFLPWVAYGGRVSLDQLRMSKSSWSKLMANRFDIGLIPSTSFLEQDDGDQQD